MPNCGKEPNKAFQRQKWLAWQACKSGIPFEPGFGVRKKPKKPKATFE